jgi:ketosteroid isomerase-like protein
MSQENVELVRSTYAAPDILAGARDGCAPDVEFDFSDASPDGPVLRGIDELLRFRETLPWVKPLHFEAERIFDVDAERVLVFARFSTSGEGSDVPVEAHVAHEITIRDGLLVRFKVHSDRGEALRAVGLQE